MCVLVASVQTCVLHVKHLCRCMHSEHVQMDVHEYNVMLVCNNKVYFKVLKQSDQLTVNQSVPHSSITQLCQVFLATE